MGKRHQKLLLTVLTLVALVTLWQLASLYGTGKTFVSSPDEAADAFVRLASSGQLLTDIASSGLRAILGFVLGSALGLVSGLSTGRYWFMSASLGQILRMGRGVPAISIIPFVILWLGLGELSKIMIVTWAVYFAVWINVHVGVQTVPQKYIWIAQSLGANKRQILYQVILPAALPAVISGMRTGIGLAYISLFGAEMAGAFTGVGYRIYSSYMVYRVDEMIVYLIVLGLMAALTDLAFATCAKRAFPWLYVAPSTQQLTGSGK